MKTKKNNFNISPKTYNFIKYLATFGSLIFLIIPILDIMHFSNGLLETPALLNGVVFGLWTLGFLILAFYVGLRIYFSFKTKYEYKRKEKLLLWLALGLYTSVPFLTLISAIVSSVFADTRNISWMQLGVGGYLSLGILILVILVNIAASILETFSRIGEQRFLYEQASNQIDEGIVSEAGVERTSEAQKFLKDLETSTNKNTKKVAVDDKKTLDDFFKEKENQDD